MFTARFEFECTLQIEASINVPLKNFFIRNEEDAVLRIIRENETECIYLKNKLEAAKRRS